MNKKAGILMLVWFVIFILALVFLYKQGILTDFFKWVKTIWGLKLYIK